MAKHQTLPTYTPTAIINKAIAEYESALFPLCLTEDFMLESIEQNAATLLEKIFGPDARFAKLLDGIDEYPTYALDGMELIFIVGTTREEDHFLLRYLSTKYETQIRSLASLGRVVQEAMQKDSKSFSHSN